MNDEFEPILPDRDISDANDIKTLVDAFYEKVNRDELVGPIFNEVAGVEWATHLPTMYRFWESMLLGARTYQGAPFPKHAVLTIAQEHFERWLTLFAQTVNENFSGPRSEEARSRALCIADTFAQRMGVLADPSALSRHAAPTNDRIQASTRTSYESNKAHRHDSTHSRNSDCKWKQPVRTLRHT